MTVYINGVAAVGDMTKAVYDPDLDDKIALAQLVAAVCSETEAQALIDAALIKEVYTPVYGWEGGNTIPPDARGVKVDASGEYAYLMMLIPQDFTSIIALEVIICPLAPGADMHVTFSTYFGAYNGGQNWNIHSESEGRDIGATAANQNLAHDIADLVTGLAAGDLLTVMPYYSGIPIVTNAYIRGLRLKYS